MPADPKIQDMSVDVECRLPFDFGLSLTAASSFVRNAGRAPGDPAADQAARSEPALRHGVWLHGAATLLEVRESRPLRSAATSVAVTALARPAPASAVALRDLSARILNAELALQPFYDIAADHPVLGPLTRSLHGLKAFRPASLFEMLVIAVIEQQISLAAAYRIRERLVTRFGAEVEGEPVFPAPDTLAAASHAELMACGLSGRKAEYVSGLALLVAEGSLDLAALERAPSEEARDRLIALRGFGPWSADYVLIRGLARPDAVPVDDLGIRTVVGRALGDGERPPAARVAELLAPFAPFRGVAAFYLLVADRLR